MEPEPSGADPTLSEPESAPGPRTSGAAEKSGGSAHCLQYTILVLLTL